MIENEQPSKEQKLIDDLRLDLKQKEGAIKRLKEYQNKCELITLPSLKQRQERHSKPSSKGVQVYPNKRVLEDKRIALKSYLLSKIAIEIREVEEPDPFDDYDTESDDNNPKGNLIGGDTTILAVKNQNSYMLGTFSKGIKVVENKEEIYYGGIGDATLKDMIYVDSLDSYFINLNQILYKKDVDDHPPYIWINWLYVTGEVGSCYRYSNINQRLVVNENRNSLAVVNLEDKEVEIRLKKHRGIDVCDFRLFGETDTRVVSITQDGWITLYSINYQEQSGSVLSYHNIELMEDRDEQPVSIAVSDDNHYALVEIGPYWGESISSRMLVFEISEQVLVQKAVLDQHSLQIGYKFVLQSCGCVGSHTLWIGLSVDQDGQAQIYDYDSVSGELTELEAKRVSHQEYFPYRMQRLGSKLGFYYTGDNGRIMSLRIQT